jgi:hypothetical protein
LECADWLPILTTNELKANCTLHGVAERSSCFSFVAGLV